MHATMVTNQQPEIPQSEVKRTRRRRRPLAPAHNTRQASERAVAATATMTEFLAMLSHELRTPITIISGNGHLLRRDMAMLPELERSQALDDICDEAERLRALVEDLMILGNGSGPEHLEGQLEPLYVAPIAEHVILRLRHHQPDRSIRLKVSPSPALALGIPGFIEQILDNFIGNAVKYSTSAWPVDVIVGANWTTVDVHVLDRGVGIQQGEEEDVFTPFFRSARAARMAAGSGIGLAVCRRLAHAQGGHVWARARDGGGSEFALSLPRAA